MNDVRMVQRVAYHEKLFFSAVGWRRGIPNSQDLLSKDGSAGSIILRTSRGWVDQGSSFADSGGQVKT